MSQVRTSVSSYYFDDFFLDESNRQLSRDGNPVALNSKYLDVLVLLVSRAGQLVEKQHIFEEVWDGVFVTDAALTQCIKDIRKQLGDDASSPRYIKTVPKHGYIFIGTVIEADAQTARERNVATRQAARDEDGSYAFATLTVVAEVLKGRWASAFLGSLPVGQKTGDNFMLI